MEKYREFLPGEISLADNVTKSSITGKTAQQVWESRLKNGDISKCVSKIRFGPWTFLDDDFAEFQSAIIGYVPDLVQLCRWVAEDKQISDYHISRSGTNREMYCSWCGRTANEGVDDESEEDGDEDVNDIMFADFQILDCCFEMFMQELLKWREQAIVWAEADAKEWKQQAAELIAIAERGEKAVTEIKIAQALIDDNTIVDENREMGGAFWAGAGPVSQEAEQENSRLIEEARNKRNSK